MSQVSRFVQEHSRLYVDLLNNEPEMQKEQDPYGVFGVGMKTMKACEIRTIKLRIEDWRALQTEEWDAICRIAGRDIDFELDDLVALGARAQAEFDRIRAVKAVTLVT